MHILDSSLQLFSLAKQNISIEKFNFTLIFIGKMLLEFPKEIFCIQTRLHDLFVELCPFP